MALLYTGEMVLVVVQEVAVQVMLVEQEQAVLELADKVITAEHGLVALVVLVVVEKVQWDLTVYRVSLEIRAV